MSRIDLPQPTASNSNVAVQCQDLTFSYGRVSALNSADITITTGQIFALLGPSGCGKTTLLRCVLGRLKPQSGNVFVFGMPPESGLIVGYMPQEVGLVQQFTIEDIITYFGRLFEMKLEAIRDQINFLSQLLGLPDKNRRISSLSGGEQRRVSFAIAIIHRPKLLVLDEPTVGQDSLLRETIWKHLKELANKQVTILMTTHYVDEAGSADVVSVMREGKILIQERPSGLLKQLSCLNLNEAFLKLYQIDEEKFNLTKNNLSIILQLYHRFKMIGNQLNDNLKKPNLYRTKVILKKNITTLQTNLSLLLIFLIFPALIMTLIRLNGYGRFPIDIPLALHNAELRGLSQKFIEKLDFETFTIYEKPTLDEAIEMVRQGKIWAAIYIHENFSTAFKVRVSTPEKLTEDEIDESNIKLYIDTTYGFVDAIKLLITKSYNSFLDEFLTTRHNYNRGTANIPFEVENVYLVNNNIDNFIKDFSAIAYYGMIALVVYSFPMLMATHLVMFEREHLLIERSLVAGVLPVEILLAHSLTLSILLIALVAILIFTAFVIFDTFNIGNPYTVSLLIYTMGFQGITFGFFVSTFFTNRVFIFSSWCCVVPFLLMANGLIFPIESMPWFLYQLVKLSPLTLPVEALRSVALRGWTLSHFGVTLGFLINFGYAAVLLFLALIFFK